MPVGRPPKFARSRPLDDAQDLEDSGLEVITPVTISDHPTVPVGYNPFDDENLPPEIPELVRDLAYDIKKQKFLIAYAELGNRSRAARLIGLSAATIWSWCRHDKKFRAAVEKAQQIAVDLAEDELLRRATEGVVEPVFQGGHLVGGIRRMSDQLLMFYLKANRPEKYREQSDLNIKVDVADRLIKARERVFGRLPERNEE